jgi:hypothetical protein
MGITRMNSMKKIRNTQWTLLRKHAVFIIVKHDQYQSINNGKVINSMNKTRHAQWIVFKADALTRHKNQSKV